MCFFYVCSIFFQSFTVTFFFLTFFLFIDFADAFSFFFRFASGFFRLNTFGFFAFGFFFLFLQIFNEVELVTSSRVYLETVFFTVTSISPTGASRSKCATRTITS